MQDFGVDVNTLNSTAFLIGGVGGINVANVAIKCGHARAVTLVDTIVFADAGSADDLSIWAHELHHVRQFSEWGSHSFSVQYCRSYNGVENAAYDQQNRFVNWWAQNGVRYSGQSNTPQASQGWNCQGQFRIMMNQPQPLGTPCTVVTPTGMVLPGYTTN
jgi:hypothetical protein